MKPIYEENEETLEIAEQISCHIPPHLHKSMELVSVTEGTLEIGVGTELYHMEKRRFCTCISGIDPPLSGIQQ